MAMPPTHKTRLAIYSYESRNKLEYACKEIFKPIDVPFSVKMFFVVQGNVIILDHEGRVFAKSNKNGAQFERIVFEHRAVEKLPLITLLYKTGLHLVAVDSQGMLWKCKVGRGAAISGAIFKVMMIPNLRSKVAKIATHQNGCDIMEEDGLFAALLKNGALAIIKHTGTAKDDARLVPGTEELAIRDIWGVDGRLSQVQILAHSNKTYTLYWSEETPNGRVEQNGNVLELTSAAAPEEEWSRLFASRAGFAVISLNGVVGRWTVFSPREVQITRLPCNEKAGSVLLGSSAIAILGESGKLYVSDTLDEELREQDLEPEMVPNVVGPATTMYGSGYDVGCLYLVCG